MSDSSVVSTGTFVGVLGAAAVSGAAIAWAPWQMVLVVGLGAAGVLGLVLLRAAVTASLQSPLEEEPERAEDRRLRPARLAYYAGAASIGFLTIRPALGFTASDWIFLSALGVAGLVIVVQGIEPAYLLPRAITIGVLLFAIGGLLSSIDAVSPFASAFVVVRMLYLTLIWFWLGTIVLETHAHVHTALVAWVSSAALSSGGAVIQFFYGDVIAGGTIAWGRMTGFTGHFNILGGLAATAFVPALMLAVDSKRRSLRVAGSLSTGLIAAGLLLSGSVGGLLAASVATMVWLALRGISLRIFASGAVVLAAAFVLMSATGSTDTPSPVDRIKRVTSAEQADAGTGGSVYTRLEGYALAWERIVDQPFVGVGLDEASSRDHLPDHSVHNLVLGPWFTAGVLGVVGIVLLIAGALATGVRTLRYASMETRSMTAALVAALTAFIQHGMGEPILFVRYGWFPTALLVALETQRIRARPRAPVRSAAGSAATYSLGASASVPGRAR